MCISGVCIYNLVEKVYVYVWIRVRIDKKKYIYIVIKKFGPIRNLSEIK